MEWSKCLGVSLLALAVTGCGGGDSEGPGGGNGLFAQAPHCPEGADRLAIEGTIDGVTINDQRSANINAGLVNIGDSRFDTPVSNLSALAPSQLTLRFTWAGSLSFGQKAALTSGEIVGPSGSTLAGRTWCVLTGEVGFVDGGTEDGALKFRVSEIHEGEDCTGASVPVELRGCYQ